MYVPLLRNSLQRFYPKTCYQFTKNFNLLAKTLPAASKRLSLQQTLPKTFNSINKRNTSTVITKEYKSSRKFVHIWKMERLLGWTLAITIPLAFAIESKETEMCVGTAILIHTYLGCQSMCSDYLRSGVVGKILPVIVRLLIILVSIASLAGTYQLIYEDVGIVAMVKKFWAIRGKDVEPPKSVEDVKHDKKQQKSIFSFKK